MLTSLKNMTCAVVVGITLAGCAANINEGSVEVRSQVVKDAALTAVFYEDTAAGTKIKPNDTLSIRLLQAHICNFAEFSIGEVFRDNPSDPPCDNGGDGNWYDRQAARGEIAVIVNAFERKKGNSISFNYSDIKKSGRVVYYSQDVTESGQTLNALNMPIYGPITYTGKPFFLQFNILELDSDENTRMKGMLQTLAAIGQTAYPPSSGALELVNTLGGALLQGEQDDIEFRYLMEFDGYEENPSWQHHLPLSVGTYVFMRQENRSQDFDWSLVRIDQSSGKLVYAKDSQDDDKKAGEVYRSRTWFTVRIDNGGDATDLDAGQATAEFFKKNDEFTRQSLTELNDSLMGLAGSITNINQFNQAKKFIGQLGGAQDADAKAKLIKVLCDSVRVEHDEDKTKRILSSSQIDYLIARTNDRLEALNDTTRLSHDNAEAQCTTSDDAFRQSLSW